MRTRTRQKDTNTMFLPFRNCKVCVASVDDNAIECPQCGAIYFEMAHRINRQHLAALTSVNFNGEYKLLQNRDRTLNCTCHSFLQQRGVENGRGATCKHVRAYLSDHPLPSEIQPAAPAPYQLHALRELSVENVSYLTFDQANFLIQENLSRQGITEPEFSRILTERGRVSGLPLNDFGIEVEGAVKGTREDLLRALNENGVTTVAPGYTKALMNEWKIVTDGSVSAPEGYETLELVSPKLHGIEGFNRIKKALSVWNEVGGLVNRTAGLHCHIDAYDLSASDLLEIAKLWATIEARVLWGLVAPSRRNGSYCKRVDEAYLICLATEPHDRLDRRYSLNFQAFARHRTIEVRLHNGTLNSRKIIAWIILMLKLFEAVRKGLRHRQVEPTLEGVLNAIGMEENSVQILKMARTNLIKRQEEIAKREGYGPRNEETSNQADIDVDGLDRMIQERRMSEQHQAYRRQAIRSLNPALPENSIHNLASRVPSQMLHPNVLNNCRQTDGTWLLPSSRNGVTEHTVSVTTENDVRLLNCSCRGFRSHRHCYHTINIARFLALEEIVAREGGAR